MDLALLEALPTDDANVLRAVGVDSIEALAMADVFAVSSQTGIPVHLLSAWRDAAVQLVPGSDSTGIAPEVDTPAAPATGAWKVILESDGTASVHLDSGNVEGVPVVPATATEDDDAIAARVIDDAVVLKEGAVSALAFIGGAWHEDLPIYKRRDGEEVRVKVQAVRERRVAAAAPAQDGVTAPARKGGLGRLFGKR